MDDQQQHEFKPPGCSATFEMNTIKDPPLTSTSIINSQEAPASRNGKNEVNSNDVALESERVKENEEKKEAKRYGRRIVGGLLLPGALQAVDMTIVAAALSFIASDFNELPQLNLIATVFNFCSAAFIPAFGQLADLFGRHAILQGSLFAVLIGSTLSAGAQAFVMLLFGRALQGIGCAGIMILARIILADKVSLQQNSRNTSIYSLISGILYGVGPIVGGYLTDVNWRWVFIINVPIGLAAIVAVYYILRPELLGPKHLLATAENQEQTQRPPITFLQKISRIDVGGQLLFLFGIGLFILAITWGGSTYAWDSAAVLTPLIIGGILLCVFLTYEYFLTPGKKLARLLPQQQPMIPFYLIANKNMSLLCYINLAAGMSLSGVIYFTAIYFTVVEGYSASKSSLPIVYYIPGLGVGVYIAIFFCNVWPRQTFTPLFLGSVIEAVGVTILAWAFHVGYAPTIYGMMAMTAAGTGIRLMPGTLHGVGFFRNDIAPVISILSFSSTFGSTLVLSLMGSVFNNKMSIDSYIPYNGSITQATSLQDIANLPPDLQIEVREKARTAVVFAFIAVLPFFWLAVLAAASLGNVELGKQKSGTSEEAAERRSKVMNGSYLNYVGRKYLLRRSEGQEVL